jgi:hypothetical protein
MLISIDDQLGCKTARSSQRIPGEEAQLGV